MEFVKQEEIYVVVKFLFKIDGIDNQIYYIPSQLSSLEKCLILEDKVINIKTKEEYIKIEIDSNGYIYDNIIIGVNYCFDIYQYKKAILNGKLVYKPLIEEKTKYLNKMNTSMLLTSKKY